MSQARASALGRICLLLPLAVGIPARGEPSRNLPAAALRARVEAHLEQHRRELVQSPGHDALAFEPDQAELLAFMEQVHVDHDGSDFGLGVAYGPESHGGGVLALLLDAWRPDGRPARLGDVFFFKASRRALELERIYRGHRRQIFLPVPGREADRIEGELPGTPQLPRMRFRYFTDARPVETDAYLFLFLLVRYEDEPAAPWTNHLGQELSVDRLLQSARDHYLSRRDSALEIADHTPLHLVELLLAYGRRWPRGQDVAALKQRFLDVELARTRFEGEAGSEALAHYVESLGVLLADERIVWTASERARVMAWLETLERERFRDLDATPLEHQAHLLRGLRLIAAHADRLRAADR